MSTQRFSVAPVEDGKGAILPLPFDPNHVWGQKRIHHVTGEVGGCTVRGALAVVDGGYVLRLGPAWVRDNSLTQMVEVSLRPEGPQVGELPADVREFLERDPTAKEFFESLATFYRTGFINPILQAKRPETRVARINQMMESLRAHRKQG